MTTKKITFSETRSYTEILNEGDTLQFVIPSQYICDELCVEENIEGTPTYTQLPCINGSVFYKPKACYDIIDVKNTIKIRGVLLNTSTNNCIHITHTIDLHVFKSCLLYNFGSLHILNTQLIDDNNVFCVLESSYDNVMVASFHQSANRLIAYEKKKIANTIPIFTTTHQHIISALDSDNYDVIGDNVIVLLTPVSCNTFNIVNQINSDIIG